MGSEKRKRKGNEKSDVGKKRKKESEEEGSSEAVRFLSSAMGLQLSSLELDSLPHHCFLEVPDHSDVQILGKTVKAAFGASWRDHLCPENLVEGEVNAGSPAVLVISSSALRCIHLLRGFRSFTKQCHAAKLFSKHMKLPEQGFDSIIGVIDWERGELKIVFLSLGVASQRSFASQISLLKHRVNIASGTPSRIKKLIDAEALDLSRLQVLVLDMHPDVKGYSLLTLPQVRDEFWEVFKNYFYEAMIQGGLRICLYGYQAGVGLKGKHKQGSTIPDT